MGYKLKLDAFEGPLDLLLYLIKKNDVEITDIPIAEITDQYMEYIEMMKMLDLDIVGDFLVMAASLMQIKSKMLLPPDPAEIEDPEEDPRDELARRLLEYKKFKEIADQLGGHERERKDLYGRALDEEYKEQLKNEAKEVYVEASLFDLITAFQEAAHRKPEDIIHEITKEEFTIEQKIHHILQVIIKDESIMIFDLFNSCRSKREMIVTFLAMLELIRIKEIKIFQKNNFSDIQIRRNRDKPEEVPEISGAVEDVSEGAVESSPSSEENEEKSPEHS